MTKDISKYTIYRQYTKRISEYTYLWWIKTCFIYIYIIAIYEYTVFQKLHSPGRPFQFINTYINMYVYACMCAFAGEQYLDPIPNNSWRPFTELPTRKKGLKQWSTIDFLQRTSGMTRYDWFVHLLMCHPPGHLTNHPRNGWKKLRPCFRFLWQPWSQRWRSNGLAEAGHEPFHLWVFVELFLNGYLFSTSKAQPIIPERSEMAVLSTGVFQVNSHVPPLATSRGRPNHLAASPSKSIPCHKLVCGKDLLVAPNRSLSVDESTVCDIYSMTMSQSWNT